MARNTHAVLGARHPSRGELAYIVFVLTFVGAAALYAASAARGPATGDWGDFVTAASVLGIAHPTGYPTYLQFLALPLLIFPRLWAAAGANAVNALVVALAPALLALWAYRVGSRPFDDSWLAAAFAIFLGVFAAAAPSIWLEATSVEAYGPALALIFGALCLLESAESRRDARFIFAAAFILGVAPGVHLLAFGCIGVALVINLLSTPGRGRLIFPVAAAFLLGFSVLLYLPLRALSDTPLKWAWTDEGVNNALLFFRHVAGREFGSSVRWPSLLVASYRIEDLGVAVWRNAGPLAFLAPWAFWRARRGMPRTLLASLAIIVANVFILCIYDIPDLGSYRLPAIGFLLAAGAVGALASFSVLRRRLRFIAVAAAAAVAITAVVQGWDIHRRPVKFLDFYTRSIMTPFGYKAMYAAGDITTNFLYWHSRYTLGLRPDVMLSNWNEPPDNTDSAEAATLAVPAGVKRVYADYSFIRKTPDRESLFGRARPTGFVVEILPRATAPTETAPFHGRVLKEAARAIREIPADRVRRRRAFTGRYFDVEYAVGVYEDLGFFHEYRGEKELARFYYVKAAAFAPWMEAVQSNLARWYWETGDYENARRAARAALAANREMYTAYGYLAMVDGVEGNTDGALANARRTVALKPRDGYSHRLLATVYLVRGERDLARRELERAVALKYYDANTIIILSQLYQEQGRTGDALALLERFAYRNNDVQLMNAYALALIQQGRYREARAVLEQALCLQPDAPVLRANLQRLMAMGW